MSIFLSPSSERNFCFLLDKSKIADDGEPVMEEKVKVWVSEQYLAVVSPVFKTMFYGDFREATDERPICLPGKNVDEFLEFLDCLFPYPTQSEINYSNVEPILRLSDEYQVEILLRKCDEYYDKSIRSMDVGDEAVLNYVPILLKYKLNRSLNILVPYMAALHIETLARQRLENNLKLEGIDRFYSTIYEAKCRRTAHEQHWWFGLGSLSGLLFRCQDCGVDKSVIDSLEHRECLKFHKCASKDYKCLCGYDFEQLPLDK